MEGEAEEWVGWGPPVETLGEKDCLWRDGSLPAWWLFLSSRAFNGKAVPLGVWLEGMPHFSLINVSLLQISTIGRGQINWVSFWEQRNEYWLGIYRLIFFNWWFHLGPSNWSFSDLSAACPHVRCVRSSPACVCAQVPRRSVGIHLWSSPLAFCLKSVSHLNLTNLSIQSPCLTLSATVSVFMLCLMTPFPLFFFFFNWKGSWDIVGRDWNIYSWMPLQCTNVFFLYSRSIILCC